MIRLYLREWREHKGLSLLHLIARTDMKSAVLARIEHGQQSWTPAVLEKLGEAMDMDPVDLLRPPPK